jgi:AbrB family looped-hinge helix DNA binding protein
MVLADGIYHSDMPMTAKITIDKAGRVVIPKPLRQRLRLGPGDVLALRSEGECITLQPVRPQAPLKKEHGIWVYQGEATDTSIADLLDREREERIRDLRR